MQRKCWIQLVVLLVACGWAAMLTAQSACSVTPGDEAKATDALRTLYTAAAKDDLSLFHSITTADFYAFENGVRYNGDGLMNLVKSFHAAGYVYVWSVEDPVVLLDCNTALITDVNRGGIRTPKGMQHHEWLESALLEKQAGQWRVRFFHSTRMPPPSAHQ